MTFEEIFEHNLRCMYGFSLLETITEHEHIGEWYKQIIEEHGNKQSSRRIK
jgi:hypothetical protein